MSRRETVGAIGWPSLWQCKVSRWFLQMGEQTRHHHSIEAAKTKRLRPLNMKCGKLIYPDYIQAHCSSHSHHNSMFPAAVCHFMFKTVLTCIRCTLLCSCTIFDGTTHIMPLSDCYTVTLLQLLYLKYLYWIDE